MEDSYGLPWSFVQNLCLSIQNNVFELHYEKKPHNNNKKKSQILERAWIYLLSFNSLYLNLFLKMHIQIQPDDTPLDETVH